MIDLIIKTNGSERRLKLPVDEQSVPGIVEKNSVTTVMVVNEPESLRYLAGKQWSVDELNFLAKRLESFDKLEDAQFNAAVSYLQPQSIKDLINLTFNLPRYSIIRNVFNLAEVGRTYIITRQQAMSLEEIEQTDFAKIGREVLTSGKGIPTEYGLLFINEDIPEEQVYDGKHFPEYSYKNSLFCVSVSCKGETEYLYMPCSVADINNALSKLPAESWSDCKLSIEWDNLRESSWLGMCDKILQSEDAYCLNKVSEVLNQFRLDKVYTKLSAALDLANVDDSASIVTLANQLDDFIFFPTANDSYDVGRLWIDQVAELRYDEELEDYIKFEVYGEEIINSHDGKFLDNGGYIVVNEGVNLEELLKGAEEERRIHEEAMKSNTCPTPDGQNLITGRYFFPLTFDLVPFNRDGDLDWSDIYEDAGDEYADGYESEIQEAFDKYTADDECDMIEYYDRNASARDKIVSAKWGFEEIGGKHFGVVDVQLTNPLTDEEEADFKDWISGQNSDGLGEGFEQHEINTDDGLLSVHFWNPGDDYYVDNEEEFRDRLNLGMGGTLPRMWSRQVLRISVRSAFRMPSAKPNPSPFPLTRSERRRFPKKS